MPRKKATFTYFVKQWTPRNQPWPSTPYSGEFHLTALRTPETVRTINADGVTVLIVEQNVRQALALADRAAVLESGKLVLEGAGRDLLVDDRLKRAYLGM